VAARVQPEPRSSGSAVDVVVDPSTGGLFVLCSTKPGGGDDRPVVLAYSPTGRLRWQRTVEPTETALLVALSLELDPDRRSVCVLSRSVPPFPASWYSTTVSIDADSGRQRWAADFVNRSGRDYVAEELALDPNSGRFS